MSILRSPMGSALRRCAVIDEAPLCRNDRLADGSPPARAAVDLDRVRDAVGSAGPREPELLLGWERRGVRASNSPRRASAYSGCTTRALIGGSWRKGSTMRWSLRNSGLCFPATPTDAARRSSKRPIASTYDCSAPSLTWDLQCPRSEVNPKTSRAPCDPRSGKDHAEPRPHGVPVITTTSPMQSILDAHPWQERVYQYGRGAPTNSGGRRHNLQADLQHVWRRYATTARNDYRPGLPGALSRHCRVGAK